MLADVLVIGGGIVGLATAYQLTLRFPNLHVVVLEKEAQIGSHQSSHNSGVLHSGIYYRPGSLRSICCRAGKKDMESFCRAQDIPYEICGKVIVAVRKSELPALDRLLERGRLNGVQCEMIGPERLRELEPHAAGLRAIHVSEAGIVDYQLVCQRLARLVMERDGQIRTTALVTGMTPRPDRMIVHATSGDVEGRYVVNCAGLYSDRVTAMSGHQPEAMIVPFRGEYYILRSSAQSLCRHLIYPVPDSRFPFLGVHFTRRIDGRVECGPNAVLAFAREGYGKTDVNLGELFETLSYPGFLQLARKHWRMGLAEMWRSLNKQAFVRALQQLIPAIQAEDLEPTQSGVRAQALARDGSLIDDFLIWDTERVINIGNAPSPAATASLNIAQAIVDRLSARLG
jgi:L-2-hydroxyglutarate oxidase LhgO